MKRHRWKDNRCVRCNVIRERRTRVRVMAIVNHPPWEVRKYESRYRYETGDWWTWERPECKSNKSK